jgi:hypothetical protein
LYGTREVDTALQNEKEAIILGKYKVSAADQLVVVMKPMKVDGAKGLASLIL